MIYKHVNYKKYFCFLIILHLIINFLINPKRNFAHFLNSLSYFSIVNNSNFYNSTTCDRKSRFRLIGSTLSVVCNIIVQKILKFYVMWTVKVSAIKIKKYIYCEKRLKSYFLSYFNHVSFTLYQFESFLKTIIEVNSYFLMTSQLGNKLLENRNVFIIELTTS